MTQTTKINLALWMVLKRSILEHLNGLAVDKFRRDEKFKQKVDSYLDEQDRIKKELKRLQGGENAQADAQAAWNRIVEELEKLKSETSDNLNELANRIIDKANDALKKVKADDIKDFGKEVNAKINRMMGRVYSTMESIKAFNKKLDKAEKRMDKYIAEIERRSRAVINNSMAGMIETVKREKKMLEAAGLGRTNEIYAMLASKKKVLDGYYNKLTGDFNAGCYNMRVELNKLFEEKKEELKEMTESLKIEIEEMQAKEEEEPEQEEQEIGQPEEKEEDQAEETKTTGEDMSGKSRKEQVFDFIKEREDSGLDTLEKDIVYGMSLNKGTVNRWVASFMKEKLLKKDSKKRIKLTKKAREVTG